MIELILEINTTGAPFEIGEVGLTKPGPAGKDGKEILLQKNCDAYPMEI